LHGIKHIYSHVLCNFLALTYRKCQKNIQSKFVEELTFKNIFCLSYTFDLKHPKFIIDNRVLCILTFTSRFHFSGKHETPTGGGCSIMVHNDDYLDDIKPARKSTRLSGDCRSYIFHRVTQCTSELLEWSLWHGESSAQVL